jgi:hypothetical protein
MEVTVSDTPEGHTLLGALGRGLVDALFEDEPQKQTGSSQGAPTASDSKVKPINPSTANVTDTSKMVSAIAERVFVGGTLYTEYIASYEALSDAGFDESSRRKAAFLPLIKKHGVEGVATAITSHLDLLNQEREKFARSLDQSDSNPVKQAETEIADIERNIASKKEEIKRLEHEVAERNDRLAVVIKKVAEARAEQDHAKAVFDAAIDVLSARIADDQAFLAQHKS